MIELVFIIINNRFSEMIRPERLVIIVVMKREIYIIVGRKMVINFWNRITFRRTHPLI